jgi:hypothetical protein
VLARRALSASARLAGQRIAECKSFSAIVARRHEPRDAQAVCFAFTILIQPTNSAGDAEIDKVRRQVGAQRRRRDVHHERGFVAPALRAQRVQGVMLRIVRDLAA